MPGAAALADHVERRLQDGLRAHLRGVQDDGIRRRPQGRGSAFAVAGITLTHFLQNAGVYTRLAAILQLLVPAPGPGLVVGRDEQLERCLRADHGADVSAVQDRPGLAVRRLGGEAALEVAQRGADRGYGGHHRGRSGGLLTAQVAALEVDGSAGGGLVRVTMNGKGEMRAIRIDPSLMKPDEAEIVEDLIVAAHKDAKDKAEAEAAEKTKALTAGPASSARAATAR